MDIVERLLEDALHHDYVATQCDCAPEVTVNHGHALNARHAAGENKTADRTGYCAWCKHIPHDVISVAARNVDSKCHLCWFTDDKPNWEKAPNVKLTGSAHRKTLTEK